MNAQTFFSESTFLSIQKDFQAQKPFDCTKYRKAVKVNGNTYTLSPHASFLQVGDYSYFCTCWYDYNYKGKYEGREIGGGSGPSIICSTYEEFCERLNQILRRYPDYTEPVFTPVQLSLW